MIIWLVLKVEIISYRIRIYLEGFGFLLKDFFLKKIIFLLHSEDEFNNKYVV
jgi:hypothetical protein